MEREGKAKKEKEERAAKKEEIKKLRNGLIIPGLSPDDPS